MRFGPDGARVDHDLHTGAMPTDINGPHGIAISPDKKFYYVTPGPRAALWHGLEIRRRR